MAKQSIVLTSDKKLVIFIVIFLVAVIIALLFWRSENTREQLEESQIKVIELNQDVAQKIDRLDSLYQQNSLLTDQYQQLRSSFVNLQQVIVAKRNQLPQMARSQDQEELKQFLAQLNDEIMSYEETLSQLNSATHDSLNDEEAQRILAENQRLQAEVIAARGDIEGLRAENQQLRDAKLAAQRRILELTDKLAALEKGEAPEDLAALVELRSQLERATGNYRELQQETQQLMAQKETELEEMQQEIGKNDDLIQEAVESSFAATYKFREGRRGQITTALNTAEVHQARNVRNIDVSFVVPRAVPGVQLSLLLEQQGQFVAHRYDKKDVPISNFQGQASLPIEPRLDAGNYMIRVEAQGQTLFEHRFTITQSLF